MSANIEALSLETEKAEVSHGEDPALSVVDGLPRLLLERYYKRRRSHSNWDSVVPEVLFQVFCDLLNLASKSLVLCLRRKFCLVSKLFNLEEACYVTNSLSSVNYLKRFKLKLYIQVVFIFII